MISVIKRGLLVGVVVMIGDLSGGCAFSRVPRGYYSIALKNGSRTDTIRDVYVRAEMSPSRAELGPLRIETMFPLTKPMPAEVPVRWTSADGIRHDLLVPVAPWQQPETEGIIAFVITADNQVRVMTLGKDEFVVLLADRLPSSSGPSK